MQKRKIFLLSSGLVIIFSLLVAGTTLAASQPNSAHKVSRGHYAKPMAVGTVTAINGSSFTLQKNIKGKNPKTISYTVNTSSSTVFKKDGQTAGLSDLTVGAKIMVSGTIDKTTNTVTASYVYINTKPLAPKTSHKKTGTAKTPHYVGKIIAINGTSFSLQRMGFKNNKTVTYAVDTSTSTTYKKDGQSAAFSDLAVGEQVSVTGTLNASTNIISATGININTHAMFFHK